eukprot:COSAG05_NODE_2624_length_2830_cov_2.644819_5_plen_289_part_00
MYMYYRYIDTVYCTSTYTRTAVHACTRIRIHVYSNSTPFARIAMLRARHTANAYAARARAPILCMRRARAASGPPAGGPSHFPIKPADHLTNHRYNMMPPAPRAYIIAAATFVLGAAPAAAQLTARYGVNPLHCATDEDFLHNMRYAQEICCNQVFETTCGKKWFPQGKCRHTLCAEALNRVHESCKPFLATDRAKSMWEPQAKQLAAATHPKKCGVGPPQTTLGSAGTATAAAEDDSKKTLTRFRVRSLRRNICYVAGASRIYTRRAFLPTDRHARAASTSGTASCW